MRRVILFRWLGVAVALHAGLFASITFGSEDADKFSHLHQHIDAVESGQGDGDEETLDSCTATWQVLLDNVLQGERWSFATGAPEPERFGISPSDCQFDTETPANTPLALPPPVWNVTVDDRPFVLIGDILSLTGEITFVNNVDAGSTVVIEFYFQLNQNPTPDPVPLPSLGNISLAILAGLFVIVVTLRLNRRKLRRRI